MSWRQYATSVIYLAIGITLILSGIALFLFSIMTFMSSDPPCLSWSLTGLFMNVFYLGILRTLGVAVGCFLLLCCGISACVQGVFVLAKK